MRVWLLLFVVIACLLPYGSIAQTTGYGCIINNRVYTTYLGTGYPYGPFSPLKVYKSNGPSVAINYNGNNGSAENYICGQINYYYYYPTGTVAEMTIISYDCITEATLGGPVVGAGGTYVSYSYNNPSKCSSTPVPIENKLRLSLLTIGIACLGAYILRKQMLLGKIMM